ncbi:MAG: STT3 domain-containing protein [Nanoarchaeota archaeon]|nr:STT3 domain-containing protein [Nanoarchaeota archaeon]
MEDNELSVAQHHNPAETANETGESLSQELQQRKKDIIDKLQKQKSWLIYIAMLAIAWFGYYIRTRNLPLLQGKWLPDVDSYAFLRYAEYIVEHGKLMANDVLRYYPFGFDPRNEFGILSYLIAYLYKILHLFNPNATVIDAAALYPPICFFIAAIFFFLFVKKLFNYKTAIVATAFLAVVPAFLYRTMAGVADKEALAVALMFAALYFFTATMKPEQPKHYITYSLLAGAFIGILGGVWGGVQFIFITMGLYGILGVFFDIFEKKQKLAFCISVLSCFPIMMAVYPTRYNIDSLVTSMTTQIFLLGLLAVIISIAARHKAMSSIREKAEKKMPFGLFVLVSTLMLAFIALIIFKGPGMILSAINEAWNNLTGAFTETRWTLTVAENRLTFFTEWLSQFSWKYLIMAFAGAIMLFAVCIKGIKTKKTSSWALIAASAVFFLAIPFSRYAQNSLFNGDTAASQVLYISALFGFPLLLGYFYVRSYYKDRKLFESIKINNAMYVFALVWFTVLLLGGRSAIRLVFILAPATALMAGYFTLEAFEWTRKLKKDAYKIAGYIALAAVVGSAFYGFSQSSLTQASYVGPSFNMQWQNSMSWVKENTPENAVFAHWWDYGYWVQWGGKRATIVDGGNAMGGVNHFVGRHVLTAQNETEALEFLKSRNVSHLLIVSDEIGKYPAYSSIGADRNYDRYSWISTFAMQPNQIRETRNETVYLFAGGTPLDDDFIYQGKLFPAGSAGVAGFFLPVQTITVSDGNETKNVQKLGQPEAVIVYNGQQTKVPLKCVFINNQEAIFNAKDSLEGCLRVIPTIEGDGKMNPLGAALYLSPEVYKGLFAKLYLLNQDWPNIKLAYSDENTGMPLALYQGRLIGPFKIWKVDYPENITVPEEYYGNIPADPEVSKPRR